MELEDDSMALVWCRLYDGSENWFGLDFGGQSSGNMALVWHWLWEIVWPGFWRPKLREYGNAPWWRSVYFIAPVGAVAVVAVVAAVGAWGPRRFWWWSVWFARPLRRRLCRLHLIDTRCIGGLLLLLQRLIWRHTWWRSVWFVAPAWHLVLLGGPRRSAGSSSFLVLSSLSDCVQRIVLHHFLVSPNLFARRVGGWVLGWMLWFNRIFAALLKTLCMAWMLCSAHGLFTRELLTSATGFTIDVTLSCLVYYYGVAK